MCQLRCPICSTGKDQNKNGTIGWGYLRFKDFKALVDQNPKIQQIELSNYGEIFLNPELHKIIRYAYIKEIILTAENGVNLNTVKPEILKELIEYKFQSLVISLDGASDKTYKKYRNSSAD